MKIKPLTVWVLVVAAIAVAYAILGVAYLRQKGAQEALGFELGKLRLIAAGREQPTGDMERRLVVAQARLDTAQATFPDEWRSTEVMEWVLQLARESQVKALPINVRPLSKERFEGHVCDVSRLEVKVEGGLPQLLAFMGQLEGGPFKTLVLEKASITTTPGGANATLSLAAHVHPVLVQPAATPEPKKEPKKESK